MPTRSGRPLLRLGGQPEDVIDEERARLYFSPRKPGSGWARTNKARVSELRMAGMMTDAGEAVISRAMAEGSWSLLDDVENLLVPPDLAAALAQHPADAGLDRHRQAPHDPGDSDRGDGPGRRGEPLVCLAALT